MKRLEAKEMLRAVLIALVLFSSTPNAFGQDLEVSSISKDLKQAMLKNQTTGAGATVAKGQEIEGWRIVEITPSEVTLGKLDSNGTVLLRHLPVTRKVNLEVQEP